MRTKSMAPADKAKKEPYDPAKEEEAQKKVHKLPGRPTGVRSVDDLKRKYNEKFGKTK
jgi:hypothetical protein